MRRYGFFPLTGNKGEPPAKFDEERFKVPDDGFFQFAFPVLVGEIQEFQNVGIANEEGRFDVSSGFGMCVLARSSFLRFDADNRS